MKQTILTIILLLTLLPATAATKKPQANPINIAAILVEKTDSAKVASSLEYYGYTPQGTEDGYCVMKNSTGNEIRFSFNENGTLTKYPTVIVKHNANPRDLNSRLKELNFEKSGTNYEKAKNTYSRYIIKCFIGPHNTLTFRRSLR